MERYTVFSKKKLKTTDIDLLTLGKMRQFKDFLLSLSRNLFVQFLLLAPQHSVEVVRDVLCLYDML